MMCIPTSSTGHVPGSSIESDGEIEEPGDNLQDNQWEKEGKETANYLNVIMVLGNMVRLDCVGMGREGEGEREREEVI